MSIYLSTLGRADKAKQRNDSTQVQFGEPVSLIGFIHKGMHSSGVATPQKKMSLSQQPLATYTIMGGVGPHESLLLATKFLGDS